MRILGIDYGRKRLGLAICGELKIASPLGKIVRKSMAEDLAALSAIISEEEVATIVVGLPKNMDDSCGEMAKESNQFAQILATHFSLPVQLWDERLTSYQAERDMITAGLSRSKRQKSVDQVAAALILQNYVDCKLKE